MGVSGTLHLILSSPQKPVTSKILETPMYRQALGNYLTLCGEGRDVGSAKLAMLWTSRTTKSSLGFGVASALSEVLTSQNLQTCKSTHVESPLRRP